ncbi:MAG: tRNA lysidine(34) synthetase TilS [Bacteroidales bacterium]|nr:tRNA lysidine(34) synthetase TilS [Bacteroidales bacterium]
MLQRQGIVATVETFLKRYLTSDGKILVGVSGGVDSTVLLHILATLSSPDGYKGRFSVAHMNFCLRGVESEGDEAFVKELCNTYGFALFTKRVDTLSFAKERGLSVEMAARELRYDWFKELAKKEDFAYLLTAHNANDNAETLILNLVRGTGRHGLNAIRQMRADGGSLVVLRPLLSVERSEIENYAKEHNLSFRYDRTNSDNVYARNLVRNKVLPLLKEINPSVIATLNDDIERFREENEEIDSIVSKELSEAESDLKDGGADLLGLKKRYLKAVVPVNFLKSKSNVKFWIAEILHKYNVSFAGADVNDIAESVSSDSGTTKFFILKGYTVTIERGELRLYDNSFLNAASDSVEISDEGEFELPPYRLSVRKLQQVPLQIKREKGVLLMDESKVKFPLRLRFAKEGDRFSPFGLKGSKSVADFLNSKKLDTLFKSVVPVVEDACGTIISIPPVEITDGCKITESTLSVIETKLV